MLVGLRTIDHSVHGCRRHGCGVVAATKKRKYMENSSTFDPYNSTITRWVLTKNSSLKQQEEFNATTFITNIIKLHTNPKVLIQGFVWSFEILATNV